MLPCLPGMLMPSSGAPVALRRMVSYRLVLGTALVTAIISAAAAAALASFATGALPRAVHHQLGVAPGTSILVTGTVNATQAAQDGPP